MNAPGVSVVLLGFSVSDDVLNTIAERSSVLPTQTHKFAWNLIASVRSAGMDVSVASALPVPNFPEYPQIVIRSTKFEHSGINGVGMGFVNLLVLKHLSRFYTCLTQGIPFIRSVRPDVVVVHGVHTPFLIFARLLKVLFGVRICVVMTDPPGVIRSVDGWCSRILKTLDRKLVRAVIGGFDGLICLTEALGDDFGPQLRRLVLEGFANAELARIGRLPSHTPGEFVIAYAGGITAEYGVENLVRAFRSIPGPHLRLRLYGKGALDSWVREQCIEDVRIEHEGLVAHEELMFKLCQAAVLVNPRPVAQAFVKYSFPSKLLEYLSLGVPVVSTRLTGVPDDYWNYVQLTSDDSIESLAMAIESVRSDYAAAVQRASKGQTAILANKSVSAQGKRLAAFFEAMYLPN